VLHLVDGGPSALAEHVGDLVAAVDGSGDERVGRGVPVVDLVEQIAVEGAEARLAEKT